MIKVIHVISDANIGGAGTLLLNYLKNFDRERFEIKVVVPSGSLLIPSVKELGYEVIETANGQNKSFDVKQISALKKIFKSEKPDIVHTHSSFAAKLAAFLAGVKTRIYTRHCVFDMPWYLCHFPGKQINGLVNNTLATKIIAVAEAAKKNLTDTGISEKKISVIINGVEPLKEMSTAEKNDFRKSLGIGENDFVVGISARLEEVKGHEYFIRAAEIISKEEDDVRFLIMGTGSLEEKLKAQAKEAGLAEKIIFTGFVNNVTPYVNIMDLNANCSFGTEATSLALAEGMSLKKPAVVTVYGGNPYMVEDGKNGYLVPIKDAEKFAEAVLKVKRDKALYADMSEKAYQQYLDKFTASAMTRQLEKIYEQETR